jgi:hypothetical protein
MRRVMPIGILGLVVIAMGLVGSAGLAQNVEQVKPVFEHVIPNTEGKSMVALVVTYPPGAKIAGPSSCQVGIHLRSRADRRYSEPGWR